MADTTLSWQPSPAALLTPRLLIEPVTLPHLEAWARGRAAFAAAIAPLRLPPDWPVFEEGLTYWHRKLDEDAAYAGWCAHLVAARATGAVEIGYAVLPAHRNQGLATELAGALAAHAFARGARAVRATTLADGYASMRVLAKAGFALASQTEEYCHFVRLPGSPL